MAITSKTQLTSDIAASTFTAPQKVILDNIVDSYEDIFAQLTTAQRNALTPTDGLVIYNTDNTRYEYWNGASWLAFGQDTSTPITVKVDLSSADLLTIKTVPVELVAASGTGTAIIVHSITYRYTYGSVVYDFNYGLYAFPSSKDYTKAANYVAYNSLNSSANSSGIFTQESYIHGDGVVENDSIVLGGRGANPTQGDGALTVWVTYSIVVF